MKISSVYVCNKGNIRIRNQDNLYFGGAILKQYHLKPRSRLQRTFSTKKAVCYGIFDGMGGEQYGEMASFIAAKCLKNAMMKKKSGRIPRDILYETCHVANKVIFHKALELKAKRIGTTAAMVYIQYDRIWCCNVGDSRIYRLREGILSQLSYDHIHASKEKINYKPGLAQHLGMNPEEKALIPYSIDYVIREGDIFLICSDGLTDMVSSEEIENILREKLSVKEYSKQLLERALCNGGRDNITIILFKIIQ